MTTQLAIDFTAIAPSLPPEPPPAPVDGGPLDLDVEAYFIRMTPPTKSGRQVVEDACRARVRRAPDAAHPDTYLVQVTHAGRTPVGYPCEVPRAELYVTANEWKAFKRLIDRLWTPVNGKCPP